MKTFSVQIQQHFTKPPSLMEVLLFKTKFNESILLSALEKGAVWVKNNKQGTIRCRDKDQVLELSDQVLFYYDPKVLSLPILESARILFETQNYGVWYKEAGVLSQGSQAGDHTSLLRLIERKKGMAYLIHRLDRETSGVMIFAYNKKAAHLFSTMFQNHKIKKTYHAIVKGQILSQQFEIIDFNLDDKKAITYFRALKIQEDQTLVEVNLETGRLHQIRRHFEMLGHPLMGDPKYGKGNKNRDGLKLMAKELKFQDPWSKKEMIFTSPDSLAFQPSM